MSGADLGRIREDHGLTQIRREDGRYKAAHLSFGVSYRTGFRQGWWDAVEWVLATQRAMDRLDTADTVAELRKGAGSIFYPLFEHDPAIWLECPRCDMRTLHTAQGCTDCGHDYQ